MQDFEYSKLLSSVVVALATVTIKLIYNYLTRDGERMKIRSSSVELIDKVINERDWKKKENRIVIEEAFEQLFSVPVSFYEIKALLYTDTPNKAFKTYLKYRPALEFNDKKTKIKYRKGRESFWYLKSIKIPKAITKGGCAYLFFSLSASYLGIWLNGLNVELVAVLPLWLIVGLFWIIAVLFLIDSMKYHFSEKELTENLGSKFELNK